VNTSEIVCADDQVPAFSASTLLVGRQERHPARKKIWGDDGGRHWLVRMVSVSDSVNLPLHHKVQKFSSGTGSPCGPRKRAVKWLWWH